MKIKWNNNDLFRFGINKDFGEETERKGFMPFKDAWSKRLYTDKGHQQQLILLYVQIGV